MLQLIPFQKLREVKIKYWKYNPLTEYDDHERDSYVQQQLGEKAIEKERGHSTCIFITIIALLLTSGVLYFAKTTLDIGILPIDPSKHCLEPSTRMEWRSMNATSQQAYISAVICLMHHPSIFQEGTSYYDDFIYAHAQAGRSSHYAAAFLPWHRMFVHVFEQALQEKCAYRGVVPYWDWTLDSADISKSPIWDRDHGFGGNGDASDPMAIHTGLCVHDGPFANMPRAWKSVSNAEFHDVIHEPHCLSRDFLNAGKYAEVNKDSSAALHSHITPAYVEETLKQADYMSFFTMFETGAHNAVPRLIRGDWLVFSAPNDPVFFLHHAQVDRLWWLWQQRDAETRTKEYHGPNEDFRHHSESAGSEISDVLPMGGLVDDGRVEDFMDTTNGILCYQY